MGGALGAGPDIGPGRKRLRWPALVLLGTAAGAALFGVGAAALANVSDTDAESGIQMTAATVELGRGGSRALDYADLELGKPQTERLTVSYAGSIPADVSLRFRPGRDSACDGRSAPGGELLITVGSHGPVAYCTLLGGQPLVLEQKAPPGWSRDVAVTVELGEDAGQRYGDLSARDVLTVRASNGFTDRIDGSLRIRTETPVDKAGANSSKSAQQEVERTQPSASPTRSTIAGTGERGAAQSRVTPSPTGSPSSEPAEQPTGEPAEQPTGEAVEMLAGEPAGEPAATASEKSDEELAPTQTETPTSKLSAG